MNDAKAHDRWISNTLINIADYHNGAAFKAKDWVEDGLPIIRIEQLNNADSDTDKYDGFLHPNNSIDDGDLIFSWSATLKVVIWNRGPGALNQHLYKVVPKQGIDRHLLLQILDFNMNKLSGQSQGSTMKHVTRRELSKFVVKYPSGEKEQRKIACILQTIDQSIEKTEALIEKYQKIKAGLMHDLFTRGIGPDGKLRPPREQAPELYQETPIGWIPKAWTLANLKSCIEIHNNLRMPLSSEVRDKMGGEFPYYGPTGIVDYINEYRVEGKFVLIGEDGDHFLKFNRMEMTQLAEGKFNVNNHAHILKGTDICSTEWFFIFYLHRDIRFWLTRQGAGRYKLNKSTLEKLPIALPSIEEQEAIIKLVFHYRDYIKMQRDVHRKLRLQKSGLMHDLLTGKVEVKAD
ncbi:MAG: restriction endonuclease subunit S [Gammaproteobacteria bacterium]